MSAGEIGRGYAESRADDFHHGQLGHASPANTRKKQKTMGYNIQFVFDETPSPNWAQLRAQLEGLAGDYRLVDDPDVPTQPDDPTQLRAGEIRADGEPTRGTTIARGLS